jgi:hypothetical protein
VRIQPACQRFALPGAFLLSSHACFVPLSRRRQLSRSHPARTRITVSSEHGTSENRVFLSEHLHAASHQLPIPIRFRDLAEAPSSRPKLAVLSHLRYKKQSVRCRTNNYYAPGNREVLTFSSNLCSHPHLLSRWTVLLLLPLARLPHPPSPLPTPPIPTVPILAAQAPLTGGVPTLAKGIVHRAAASIDDGETENDSANEAPPAMHLATHGVSTFTQQSVLSPSSAGSMTSSATTVIRPPTNFHAALSCWSAGTHLPSARPMEALILLQVRLVSMTALVSPVLVSRFLPVPTAVLIVDLTATQLTTYLDYHTI